MTRASRAKVNYYEETLDDSEASDFELEEAPKKKARAARSKPDKKVQSVASDSKTSEDTETASISSNSQKAEDHGEEDSLERQETLVIPPSPPASSEKDEKSKVQSGLSSDESEASDAYEESDAESDYDGDVVVVVGKRGKGKAAASQKTPSTNSKPAISKKPRSQPKAAANKAAAKSTPTKPKTLTKTTRKNTGLGELLASPPSSRLSRPKLQSSGSSSSSLGSPVRSPGGVKRRATGTPLKELLKGSNVPRAGLSRRSLVKKV
ncbi:hypothetical protein EV183_003229 [Coemansia sp. RSA 2336]|nr:hypothetical protein EV183_003229 [Coemansia sp. RSA 2336]